VQPCPAAAHRLYVAGQKCIYRQVRKGLELQPKSCLNPPAARRLYIAEQKFIMVVAVIQAVFVAWAVLLTVTAGTQPLIAGARTHSLPAQAGARAERSGRVRD
jgi:hypothetical protein